MHAFHLHGGTCIERSRIIRANLVSDGMNNEISKERVVAEQGERERGAVVSPLDAVGLTWGWR